MTVFRSTGFPRAMPELLLVIGNRDAFNEVSRQLKISRQYPVHGFIELKIAEHSGKEIALVSAPQLPQITASIIEESAIAGSRTVIKIGTAYSVSHSLSIGEILVPKAAVRLERVSDFFAPVELPALPDYDLYTRMINDIGSIEIKPTQQTLSYKKPHGSPQVTSGIVASISYMSSKYINSNNKISEIIKHPAVVAVDSDTATLFASAYEKPVKTVSILLVEGRLSDIDPLKLVQEEEWKKKYALMKNILTQVTLRIIESLAGEDKGEK
ncbi:MAG: hypothetical protein F7C32_00675 [Desulfurococcales archaeon]|nr:hypothetical protein [Desulfurococcales archaeon]